MIQTHQALRVLGRVELKRIEINPKRVVEWTLIFTNTFYIAFFIGRLLKII